jgi:SPP1 gp7 family putative phage head morphogenesis protein
MVNKAAISQAVKLLGREHGMCLYRMAKAADKLEIEWALRTRKLNDKIIREMLKTLKETGALKLDDKSIIKFLFEHYFGVNAFAIETATAEMKVIIEKEKKELARVRIPRSLKDLRNIYDVWRRTGKLPPGLKKIGLDIKKEYLKKTQSVWKKYADEYRRGDEFTQENVLRKVKKAADTAEARAKTIVRTETTNYYNQARREIYDQSDAVSHYLFLAIRDQRTTKWCTDQTIDGKRGRHGLVYTKDDEITNRETPACHWNCRSEIVPLTRFNPRHKKLIEDLSMRRRLHTCHELPPGWGYGRKAR